MGEINLENDDLLTASDKKEEKHRSQCVSTRRASR